MAANFTAQGQGSPVRGCPSPRLRRAAPAGAAGKLPPPAAFFDPAQRLRRGRFYRRVILAIIAADSGFWGRRDNNKQAISSAVQIGLHHIDGAVVLAPMAGITDQVFRDLCLGWGASLATTEMIGSRPELRASRKTRLRIAGDERGGPLSVQIAGYDPAMMADAARFCVDAGADIIDINMGCPAKKVCNKAAGSALLRDEALVARILERVCAAVPVPVTLKTRTGWSPERLNGARIARIAEAAGVAAITVHGRTRACQFKGSADYGAIAAIKAAVGIPVIANGDIRGPEQARAVLARTGADAVMVGRGAQGRPWLFAALRRCLSGGEAGPPPAWDAMAATVLRHLDGLYGLYGEDQGVRIARKHLRWYLETLGAPAGLWRRVATQERARLQYRCIERWLQAPGTALAA